MENIIEEFKTIVKLCIEQRISGNVALRINLDSGQIINYHKYVEEIKQNRMQEGDPHAISE